MPADPESASLYKTGAKKRKSSVNVAVANFFNASDMASVDLSGYAGDVAVVSARVRTVNENGIVEDDVAVRKTTTTQRQSMANASKKITWK